MATSKYGRDLVANAGVALARGAADDSAVLVRLSDGATWTIALGAETAVPLWVDETHAWLILASEDVVGRATGTIVRIARSSLGDAQPPSL